MTEAGYIADCLHQWPYARARAFICKISYKLPLPGQLGVPVGGSVLVGMAQKTL